MRRVSNQVIHGLRLRGDLPVLAACEQDGAPGSEPDFDVRFEPGRMGGPTSTSAETVAALRVGSARYEATLVGERLDARFRGAAEFEVELGEGTVLGRYPAGGEELASILLAGNLVALILGLRGAAVLHAGTVEIDGMGIAFIGPSGAGKSTAAALLCATGAALVGDDTARIEPLPGTSFGIHRGPAEIRLRAGAGPLADAIAEPQRETADGRVAVAPRPSPAAVTALGAIAVPRWRPGGERPVTARLAPRAALEALLASPRVAGWLAPGPLRTHFEACAELAEAVPAFSVELPSERLLDPSLPAEFRRSLDAVVESAVGATRRA